MGQVLIVGSFLHWGPSVTFLNFKNARPLEENLPRCSNGGPVGGEVGAVHIVPCGLGRLPGLLLGIFASVQIY